MAQHINLLDVGVRTPRPRLSFAALLYALAGIVILLAVAHVFNEFELNRLNAELRRAQAELDAVRSESDRVAGPGARKPDPQLEAEIARLQLEVRHANDAMAALKNGSLGDSEGFAEYLRAFSRQSLDGVWLTAFTITGAGELEIRGRALRPDLVPNYIQRLNREEVLAGRSFARLEMNRTAPFLEFSLATQEAAKRPEKSP